MDGKDALNRQCPFGKKMITHCRHGRCTFDANTLCIWKHTQGREQTKMAACVGWGIAMDELGGSLSPWIKKTFVLAYEKKTSRHDELARLVYFLAASLFGNHKIRMTSTAVKDARS